MTLRKVKPHKLNVVGPFYVEDGCCTACGVPQVTAPALIGQDAEGYCYVKRQPVESGELDAMLETMAVQELGCVRYRGEDERILRRLIEVKEEAQCDAELPVHLQALVDVPSSIDLREERDAKEWAVTADQKRPWRRELRQKIAELLRESLAKRMRVLELGSGPGLLAEEILRTCLVVRYTLLDFSPPFLEMCRQRLGKSEVVRFVQESFAQAGWSRRVQWGGAFDAVVVMQAAHEIRHKRRLAALYREVFAVLRPGGMLVVCDHEPPDHSTRMTALHATEEEQHAALAQARFGWITTVDKRHGMYICAGSKPSSE